MTEACNVSYLLTHSSAPPDIALNMSEPFSRIVYPFNSTIPNSRMDLNQYTRSSADQVRSLCNYVHDSGSHLLEIQSNLFRQEETLAVIGAATEDMLLRSGNAAYMNLLAQVRALE